MNFNAKYDAMRMSVLDGDEDIAVELAEEALSSELDPMDAMNLGFLKGIREVGALYEKGEYYLPELVAAADAMNAAMKILAPALAESTGKSSKKGKIVIATVEGDIHDIGKTIVASLFTANGYDVIDLGVSVKNAEIIETVRRESPDFLGLSALLTTTMVRQKEIIEILLEDGLRSKVKVLVGGAPVNSEWAGKIGADGYGDNAAEAVKIADVLLKK